MRLCKYFVKSDMKYDMKNGSNWIIFSTLTRYFGI